MRAVAPSTIDHERRLTRRHQDAQRASHVCTRKNVDEHRLDFWRAFDASSGAATGCVMPRWHALFKKTAHIRRCATGEAASAPTTTARKWRARVIGHARVRTDDCIASRQIHSAYLQHHWGNHARKYACKYPHASPDKRTFGGVQFAADYLLDDKARHVASGYTTAITRRLFS